MSIDNRTLWGDTPPSSPQPKDRPVSPLRYIIWLMLGAIPAIIIHAFNIQPGIPKNIPLELGQVGWVSRWSLTLIIFTITETSILFWLLPEAKTSRSARIARVALGFIALGLLLACSLYLLMGYLAPASTLGERMILPALVIFFCVVLAVFSPSMPIWRINVPDNELWMLLDSNDHLIRYIGPAVHMLRPIDGFERYEQAGTIIVQIDDDSFVTSDNYPFRVRANVVCSFSPLNAEESHWRSLRNASRSGMQNTLYTEVEYTIRHRLRSRDWAFFKDNHNRDTEMNTIAMDIKEALEKQAPMGIRPVPDGINVMIDPPEILTDAMHRRMALESLVMDGERPQTKSLNVSIDSNRQMRLELKPGEELEIGKQLEGSLGEFIGLVSQAVQARQQKEAPEQPALAASNAPESQQTGIEELPPDTMPTNTVPPVPSTLPEEDTAAVIETMEDDRGVYVPRNPIVPDLSSDEAEDDDE